jgi:putative tRNA adenosine deaminase-associated protein
MNTHSLGRTDLGGYAVAVVFEESQWSVKSLGTQAMSSLDEAERALKGLRSPGAVFGLLNVDDACFIIARPAPAGTRLLLSDATAAVEYGIAADVLDALNIEVPDIEPHELDDVEPWEEGDLAILADLGLPEAVLAVIVEDIELYPDEALSMVAERMGFEELLARTVDDEER